MENMGYFSTDFLILVRIFWEAQANAGTGNKMLRDLCLGSNVQFVSCVLLGGTYLFC
jgi:hypothetical protein